VILVKPEYKNKITHIQQSTVKTGIANALGQSIVMSVLSSLCFLIGEDFSGHKSYQYDKMPVQTLFHDGKCENPSCYFVKFDDHCVCIY